MLVVMVLVIVMRNIVIGGDGYVFAAVMNDCGDCGVHGGVCGWL